MLQIYVVFSINDLRLRFEAPNENNRWDFPLFKISLSEDDIFTKEKEIVENIQIGNMELNDNSISSNNTMNNEVVNGRLDENVLTTSGNVFQSSFKSSWKPKSNSSKANIEQKNVILNYDNKTDSSQISLKTISFSGTQVTQEDTSKTMQDFLSPDIVLPKIFEYFTTATAPAPNSSTISLQKAKPDLLYELDRISQKIIEALIHQQTTSEGTEGTPLKFLEYDRAITLHKYTSLAELQRIRRQFVKINGSHPPINSKAIGSAFIDYLSLYI